MRFFRYFAYSIVAVMLALTLVIAACLYFALETSPAPFTSSANQSASAAMTADQISSRLIFLEQKSISTLAQQQLKRLSRNSSLRMAFENDKAHFQLSSQLPISFNKKYLNIDATGSSSDGPFPAQLDRLRIGQLSVPRTLIRLASPLANNLCNTDTRCKTALQAYSNIEDMRFQQGYARIRYKLGAENIKVTENELYLDQLPLEPYFIGLEQMRTAAGKRGLLLHDALQTVMTIAAKRSALGNDSTVENIAALLALTFRTAEPRLQNLIINNANLKKINKELKLWMHGRSDLSRHFLSSGALYLLAGTEFSDYVGIYKEVFDVSRGKIFGIGDLMSDRAGVRFAQHATRSQQSALELQQTIITSNLSDDYMLPRQKIDALEKKYSTANPNDVNKIITEIDALLSPLTLLN